MQMSFGVEGASRQSPFCCAVITCNHTLRLTSTHEVAQTVAGYHTLN